MLHNNMLNYVIYLKIKGKAKLKIILTWNWLYETHILTSICSHYANWRTQSTFQSHLKHHFSKTEKYFSFPAWDD